MIPTLLKSDWFHEDGFPLVVERRDPQEPFGVHMHDFSEIVIVTGGTGLHITGEDSWQLMPGDTFVIGGDRPHDYVDMEDLRLINLLFEPSELPMKFGDLPSLSGFHTLFTLEPAWRKRHQFKSRLRLTPGELADVIHIVDQLEDELSRRDDGFRVMATTLFLQLAAFLSRCYTRSRDPDTKALMRIAEAISYIERNYAEDVSLDELVEMSGMSRRSFVRAFESAMGTPPVAYLIQLRIRHACKLLLKDRSSITEIAYDVGFNDSNYFSRQFRKVIGMSPREYRSRSAVEEAN